MLIVQVIKLIRNRTHNQIASNFIGFTIIIISVIVIFVGSSIAVYLFFVETGLKEYCANDDETARSYIDKAIAMNELIHKFENILGPLNIAQNEEIAMRLCLGQKATANRQYSRSIEEYLKVLNLDSDNYMARRNMADLLFLSSRYEEAILHYQRLVQMTPPELDARYYLDMGKAYIILRNKDKAIKNLKRARELGANKAIISTYLERARNIK